MPLSVRHAVLAVCLAVPLTINLWIWGLSPSSNRSAAVGRRPPGARPGPTAPPGASSRLGDPGGATGLQLAGDGDQARNNVQQPTKNIKKFNLTATSQSNVWYASHVDTAAFMEDELTVLREVFDFVERPSAQCSNLTRLGGRRYPSGGVDGDKWACLDWPLTLGWPGCLVYSVGINDEWSFDRAAAELGCEVHSFDPSMPQQPEGQVAPGITFHSIGIGRNNHTNERGWSILVLDHLMATLGHQRRTIQYLKADAEGGEMDMLIDQLVDRKTMHRFFVLDRVEQLGLELHMRLLPENESSYYRDVLEAFRQLRRLGFDLVRSEPNHLVSERYLFPGVARPVSLLYEVLLVRRRRSTPHFDANVHYPCGSKERCDLIDGVGKHKQHRDPPLVAPDSPVVG